MEAPGTRPFHRRSARWPRFYAHAFGSLQAPPLCYELLVESSQHCSP